MSTSTLRELVEAIKTQGKALAGASGASAATARDLVYLSTSVERLFGADAILELVDSAAKPVTVVSVALASTQAADLTVDQVTKTVIKFTNTSGTHSASDFTATIPNQGVAFVVDNEMPVPVKFKTLEQTTNIISVGAGKKGWVFCNGTVVEHVIDVESITSALTSPTQNPGDMIYRDGKTSGTTEYYNVYVRNYGGQNLYYFSPYSGYTGMGSTYNYNRTPNFVLYPGVTYRFYQEDGTNTGHPIRFSTTQHGTHNSGAELTDINSDGTADITYVGTPGSSGAYTQLVIPTTGTNAATLYYYCSNHNLMGGDGVVSIPSSIGVTKLPIGGAQQVLRVSDDGNRPEWQDDYVRGGVNVGAAAPPNDVTGLWSEGRYRLGTHIENATDYPHAANKGTYTSGHHGNEQGYRGSTCLYWANGKASASAWGHTSEGRQCMEYDKYSPFNGVVLTYNYGSAMGLDATQPSQNYSKYGTKQVITCYNNTALLLEDGTVWVTGRGDEGQVGNGTATDQYGFTKVSMPSAAGPIRLIASTVTYPNSSVTFGALTESGDVYLWGYNGHGQCGSSAGTNQSTPVKHAGLSNIDSLVGGGGGQYGHWAAIDTSGNCFTWGYNGYGQLGHGNTNNTATATQVSPQAGVKVAKVVCAGGGSYGNTYFMMANGRLYACGYNGYGPIGDGSTTQRNSPVLVSTVGLETGKYVVDIFAPGGSNLDATRMALTENGDVYGWGQNARGSVGVGNTSNVYTPQIVPELKFISQFTSSGSTTSTSYYYNNYMAVCHTSFADRMKRINGTVKTAGYSSPSMGRYNVATNESTYKPIYLDARASGRVRFAWASGYHTSSTQEMSRYCIDMDGRLWAWGYSSNGSTFNDTGGSNYVPSIGH